MATTLTYGREGVCLLDNIEAAFVGPERRSHIQRQELSARVRSALASPLDYPPLAQATVPGDQVCIALDAELPCAKELLVGALQALGDAGVEEQLITVLLESGTDQKDALEEHLRGTGYRYCTLLVHDPENTDQLAMLGVTASGEALRLNRILCDADFVLPIGVGRASRGELQASVEGLFPAFSDRETIESHAIAIASTYPSHSSESLEALEQCLRLLGVGVALQVVPAGGQEVASLLSATPVALSKEVRTAYHDRWSFKVPLGASLVIATISGGSQVQNWHSVGSALSAAAAILEPGGSIVICSELAQLPGRAMGHLAEGDDYATIEREILRTPSNDCGPAIQLCRALDLGTVYLLSDLPAGIVESLGMTPIESEGEIEKLAQSFRPSVILEDAHLALPECGGNAE